MLTIILLFAFIYPFIFYLPLRVHLKTTGIKAHLVAPGFPTGEEDMLLHKTPFVRNQGQRVLQNRSQILPFLFFFFFFLFFFVVVLLFRSRPDRSNRILF